MGSVAGPTGKIDRRSGWKTLEPDRVLPRWEWPDRPTLEIVTGGKGNPRGFARNFGHAWLRLVDVDGSVCSVGFFPDESGAISPDLQPGLRMPGMLLHPDKYDGLRYPTRTTSIRLNADRFHAVRRHIEQLQPIEPTARWRSVSWIAAASGFSLTSQRWQGCRSMQPMI